MKDYDKNKDNLEWCQCLVERWSSLSSSKNSRWLENSFFRKSVIFIIFTSPIDQKSRFAIQMLFWNTDNYISEEELSSQIVENFIIESFESGI